MDAIDIYAARDAMDRRLAPLYAQEGRSGPDSIAALCAGSGVPAAALMRGISAMSGATAEGIYTSGGLTGDDVERLGLNPQRTIETITGYLLKTWWWGYEAGKAARDVA